MRRPRWMPARSALTEAATVTADITASGLDVGVADTSVDTADLREAMDRLSAFELVPVLLLPDVTEDVTTETRRVLAGAAELRESPRGRAGPEGRRRSGCSAAAAAAAEAAAEAQRQAEAAARGSAAASRARRGSRSGARNREHP